MKLADCTGKQNAPEEVAIQETAPAQEVASSIATGGRGPPPGLTDEFAWAARNTRAAASRKVLQPSRREGFILAAQHRPIRRYGQHQVMVDFARTETGVLSYQRFVSDDDRLIYLFERYADSVSAIAHLHNFAAKFSERFARMVDRKRFLVMGSPTHDLTHLLEQYGATYLRPFGPCTYWG